MNIIRKYNKWRGWGFAPRNALYLALKYRNL